MCGLNDHRTKVKGLRQILKRHMKLVIELLQMSERASSKMTRSTGSRQWILLNKEA